MARCLRAGRFGPGAYDGDTFLEPIYAFDMNLRLPGLETLAQLPEDTWQMDGMMRRDVGSCGAFLMCLGRNYIQSMLE